MSSILQVSETMQKILSTRAKALERETGGCRNAAVCKWMDRSFCKRVC